MYRLPSVIFFVLAFLGAQSQSPHGDLFKIDCAACHNPSGWSVNRDSVTYDHTKSGFVLDGKHDKADCKSCHASLKFDEAPAQCSSCHKDVHAMSLGNDCARCHSTNNWLVDNIPELHEQSGFPLVANHSGLSCTDCHKSETNLRFDRIGNECVNCHRNDFTAAKNPDHVKSGFSTNCTECHDPGSIDWTPDHFNHDFFPLTGGHDIQDCSRCHRDNNFTNVSTECSSCHMTDYNGTQNPKHADASISTTCNDCHSTTSWIPATFDHSIFPFAGAHIPIANNCNLCHHGNYTSTPNTCAGCHLPDYTSADNPDHAAGHYPTDCAICHDESGWSPSSFAHTSFPLTGAHAAVTDCNLCHNGNFTNTPNTCAGCHMPDYTATTNPNHTASQIPNTCAVCHTTTGWVPASFNHTAFPLLGAHAAITDCNQCHHNNYTNTPNTCAGCHMPDYTSSDNPDHASAHYPTDCALCHNESGWSPSGFTHNSFPLTGAHAAVTDCNLCHNGNFSSTPNTCAGCHMPDYTATTNPNHASAQIPNTCAVCHTTTAWIPASFNHTSFPLVGAHAAITDCNLCHQGNYSNTPNTCVACHLDDYNATTNPDHASAQFPTDCAECHNETAWVPATLDHSLFPLIGGHMPVANDCNLCHQGNYTNTPNTCESCHMPDYNNTSNPNHSLEQFPVDCNQCHDVTAWTPSHFDHSIYPFAGAHIPIANDCILCHNGSYTNTPNTCAGCHMPDYNSTSNPNHTSAQFSTDCATCHIETGWIPSTFQHSSFPLVGAHAAINDCNLCHQGNYTTTPNTCAGCHLPDYNSTTNPNHAAAQFPTDCATCHNESGWIPSTFSHSSFPLVGAHASITDCNLCHQGNYTNTPNTCAGCHLPDYNSTTNPNHTAAQFPTDCAICHNETAWIPSSFTHSAFPLVGAHAAITDCNLCHQGNYTNTPNTCAGCHMPDYNATSNPNHNAAGFPTQCATCHNETAWVPSTFDHDAQYFPIYTGSHDGKWNICADCHTNSANYAIFSCIDCHEHSNQVSVDQDHSSVNGYSYNSTACLNCHPDGQH